MLISMMFMFTSLLVVALAQTPMPSVERSLTGDGDGPVAVPQPDNMFQEYRAPIITVSAVGLVGIGAALAFSGGVKYIDRRNVLESPVRREMFEYIKANPGVYLREISRALDINPTNTSWHLRKLGDAELVKCQMANGLKLYYPVEGGMKTKQTALANSILKNENARTVVAYLMAHPGAHQREIARALGVNHGTVRWHLKKLVLTDIVNEHADGAAYKYYISSDGMEVLGRSGELDEVFASEEETLRAESLDDGDEHAAA